MMGGTLLCSGEQRLYNLKGFNRGVFVEIVGATDSTGCSHQSYAVVLYKDCSPDHSTVQLREPERESGRF